MDEWLGIFNVKLRHMREDIESVKKLVIYWISQICFLFLHSNFLSCDNQIETRNNKLETQSVNNKALIEELDKLLECLRVPSEVSCP